jgi:hypothetical protein
MPVHRRLETGELGVPDGYRKLNQVEFLRLALLVGFEFFGQPGKFLLPVFLGAIEKIPVAAHGLSLLVVLGNQRRRPDQIVAMR